MQESCDLTLSHMHQQPWAQLVAKFNRAQTDARKPSQPGIFFTEDEFNAYSLQPSWKQLIAQKEQELLGSSQNAPPAVPPAGLSQVKPPTVPQAVGARPQGGQQPGKDKGGQQPWKDKGGQEPGKDKGGQQPWKDKGGQQPGKDKTSTDHQVAPPTATSRQHQGKTKGRLPYPRPSWLTKAEQKLYLELYDKYMSYVPTKASAAEVKEINQLKELQLRVAAEQNEYMSFLETSARTFPEDYAYIHTEASTYVEKHLSWKRSRVTLYPRYYTILDSVSLAPPRSIAEHVSFVHVQTLLCLGTIPKVILPNVRPDMRPHVPMNYAKVNSMIPAAATDHTSKKVCSVDDTAERLAVKYKVDVVISASGLKCLLDNSAPVYPQSWELPVGVREYPGEGDSSHRVVYIDQPLVAKVMSVREKNTCYYKAALKTLLQHPRHGNPSQSCTTDETGSSLADDANRELFGSVATSLDDLETFGTGVRAAKLRQGQRNRMSVEMKVKPEEINSQSVRNLKVESSGGVCVSDREKSGRMNEIGSVSGTGASQVDSVHTALMEVDSQVDDCTVITQKPDIVASASVTVRTKGFSVVERKQFINAEVALDSHSSDSDSDNGLVIDISTNFDSQGGDGSEVNTLPCDTIAGVKGQPHERSEVMPTPVGTVDLVQDVSELRSGTDGNNKSAVTEIKREINRDVNSPVKVEINETECNVEDSVDVEEKDRLKEEVKMEQVTAGHIEPQTLGVRVREDTSQGHDNTVGDTASDMSSPRRRSQRCRTKAINDASLVSDATLTVKSPLRRSLRTGVTRSATEGGGEGEGGGKTSLGGRRRTRSVTRKTGEDGQNTGHGRLTCHGVGDIQTDAGSPATKRRRSSRLTARTQREMTTEVTCDVGVTTRSKRQRSKTPVSGDRTTRTTCRTVEDTTEEVQEETKESKVRTQDDDTRTPPDIASGDNSSCVSGRCVTAASADVSRNKTSSDTATGPDSVIGDSQSTGVANGNNPPNKVVSNNMTSFVHGTSPEMNDLSDVMLTVIGSNMQTNAKDDSDAGSNDPNTEGAGRHNTEDSKERHSQAEVSGEVGKDTRAVERGGSRSTRRKTGTETRQRQTVVEHVISNQRQQQAPCPVSGHAPLDTILLAQQKLLQPTYPSRQQHSVLPPSGCTSTLPSGGQTVAKASRVQSTAPSGEWETSENPATYPTEPPSRSDLSYDLWTLGSVRLLVRSRCHGKITPYRKPMYHVELTPKLEYQSTYGLELVTPSEAARNWTSLCIRNNCRLIRARINCFTSEVMMLEEVDMSRVVPPRCAFQPTSAVSVLHRILTKLHSLSSGQYLLSHTQSSGHANLKKSTLNDIGAYDLHRAHSGSPSTDVSGIHAVPWIPIDTSLLLPHHRKYDRIPATFEPKDAAGKPKAQQRKKKKQKKRKKKGQSQGQATAKTDTQN